MADNIIKLRVDSNEYDSKIKRASEGLQALGRNLRDAGKTFAEADAKQVEFAKELGKMQTVSNTARGKVSELSAAFVNLKSDYLNMTDAEKQSPLGQAMAQSLEELKNRTIEAKVELESLNKELDITNSKSAGGGGIKQLIGGVAGKFGMSASMFTGVGATIAAAGTAYKLVSGNIETAMNFEKSMSQLSALTGKTGEELEQLKEYAIDLGSTSTLTASQVADAFRLIGSQQPQLLASGEALKEVTKNAIMLSEAAGIDLQTAAQTLSTSINQMGGDSNNAARYVNVLAAASQKGAGDIAWLGEALTKSATAAKAVGTDYEELVANLEQLAKAGFDASTAGTALRSIIMNLEKQANNDFKPSIVGLTTAFENLGKANLDIVGYQDMVGKMFASQAMALANAAEEARNMTDAITGTNIAEEQAHINTDNLDGAIKSLSSAWEGLNLHLNSSGGLFRDLVVWMKDAVVWIDQTFTSAGRLKKLMDELNKKDKNTGSTMVSRDLKFLSNSGQFKQQEYEKTLGNYDKRINDVQEQLKNLDKFEANSPFGKTWQTDVQRADLTAQLEALKKIREEYVAGAESILQAGTNVTNGELDIDITVDTGDSEVKIDELRKQLKQLKKDRDAAIKSGDTELRDKLNAEIKTVQQKIKEAQGVTTHTVSASDRAQQLVDSALSNYAQTIKEADLRMEAGLDDTLAHKKKELQAQEQLFNAYGKAYAIYADQKYKSAYDEAANQYILLAGEVKSATDAQEAQKKAANELEQAQKKAAEEERKRAELIASWNTASTTSMTTLKQDLQKQQGTTAIGSAQFNALQANIVDVSNLQTLINTALKNGLTIDPEIPNMLMQQIVNGKDIDNRVWEELQQQLNERLKAIGVDPIDLNFDTGEARKGKKSDLMGDTKKLVGGLSQVASGLQQMGVELPKGVQQVLNVIQGAMTVIESVQTVISVFQTGAMTANTAALVALTAALWTNTTAKLIPFMARGGVVPHAANGYFVPGNNFSGDTTPIMANAGELVLNKSSQNNLASMITEAESRGRGGNGLARVSGEQIWIALNAFTKRTGKGELVTWK